MGSTFSRVKVWINEILTASDLNAEFDNVLNNLTPAGVDDASTNAAAMQATADPYPGGSPSLATSLEGELQRIRYMIKQITGKTYWYEDYGGGDWSWWGVKNLRLINVHAGDNTRVIVNPDAYSIPILIGEHWHVMTAAVDVDSVDDLDTGSLAAGTDYYIYACTDGTTLSFKVSANSTNPSGFDTSHSRKIGGFHTLCTAVGTISGHSLTDFAQKDILPASIWDLKHRAKNLVNVGLVYDSAIQKWVDIYLASGTGTSTTSVNGGTISDTRDWMDFVDDGHAVGKRLPSDHEFSSFAAGSNEETNIDNDADPGTTGGHIDSAHRRMISNIGCEDCCGTMYQWLLDQGWYSRTEGWYNLPGAKGSSYDSGDCKLVAGGHWSNAAYAGSRCRTAAYYRWYAFSNLGARFVAEPL